MIIYVVNYKETLNEDNKKVFESGVCEYGYKNEEEAIKQVKALVDERISTIIDDFNCDEDDIDGIRDSDGSYQMVSYNGESYEYFVTEVVIED